MHLILLTFEYHHLNKAKQEFNLLNGIIKLPGECLRAAVYQVWIYPISEVRQLL